MSVNTGTLAANRQTVQRLAMETLLVIIWGGLIAATRRYVDFHLGIPGSTGILWMGLLVSGRLIVKRQGAGLAIGVSSALWGLSLGFEQSPLYSVAFYSLTGAALDLATRIPAVRLERPLGAALSGALAHLTKLAFITAYAMSWGLYRHFLEVGLAVSTGYHILFGALGGLAVAVIVEGYRRHRGA